MRRALVIHADDLGLSRAFNAGILEAALHGVLTSTCVRINGGALDEAIGEVLPRCRDLGVGLHLNIVEGRTTRPRVPRASLLCHGDGHYRPGFVGLLARQRQRALLDEIEADYRDQIERALALLPRVDHLNSHQHSHGVPALYALACRLAAEYGIPFVRLPRERFHAAGSLLRHLRPWYPVNLVKHAVLNALARRNACAAAEHGVRTGDWMAGIIYTGHMRMETVLAGVDAAGRGVLDGTGLIVEVLVHPCRVGDDREERYIAPSVRAYVHDPDRARETEMLTAPALRRALLERGWTLTCYACMAGAVEAHVHPGPTGWLATPPQVRT